MGWHAKPSSSLPNHSETQYVIFTDIKEPSIPKWLIKRGIFDEVSTFFQKVYSTLPEQFYKNQKEELSTSSNATDSANEAKSPLSFAVLASLSKNLMPIYDKISELEQG